MARRFLALIPILALVGAATVAVLLVRAPKSWNTTWSTPRTIVSGGDQEEYGALADSPPDILWVDDANHRLVWTHGSRNSVLQTGDVQQPTLLRMGDRLLAMWVLNYNNGFALMAARLGPGKPDVKRLLAGPRPLEHPYLFAAPHGIADAVFSWQRPSNYNTFLVSLAPGRMKLTNLRRLTNSPIYSFYPRAVVDSRGHVDLLRLENCCQGRIWNVLYARYSASGRPIGKPWLLNQIENQGSGALDQWAEDLEVDRQGRVWGVFGTDNGADAFVVGSDGRRLIRPYAVDTGGTPGSVSLGQGTSKRWIAWSQPGSESDYAVVQFISPALRRIGRPARVDYQAASEEDVRTFPRGNEPSVLWESVFQSNSFFQYSDRHPSTQPTLAERFGLNLGNPWLEAVMLVVAAIGFALLATILNILVVGLLALVGFASMFAFRAVKLRWVLSLLAMSAVLALAFVAPGGATIVLSTLPQVGIAAWPLGWLIALTVAATLLWLGLVLTRRIEDIFRVMILAVLGVYCYAFIESSILVQQHLGNL